MAYSSENSCKKGCSCDSCKGSHKSIKSEAFKQKAADLVKRTLDYGRDLAMRTSTTPGVDDHAAFGGPGQTAAITAGVHAANDLAKVVAPRIKSVANTVISTARKYAPLGAAVAEESNYIGSEQHYDDLVYRHKEDAEKLKNEKNPLFRQHLLRIAQKSLQNVQNHPLHSKNKQRAESMSEELKTVDDVTKTLPRGVEKKGPGEAYGDVDKCAPAPKDKDKTVVAGKTGEEYSKKPQTEVKEMSEDKYAKLAEAAFGHINQNNPFRNASLDEASQRNLQLRALQAMRAKKDKEAALAKKEAENKDKDEMSKEKLIALHDRGYKPREESINNRNLDVERDISAIMKESYKKKKMMENATNIHITTPEQREDWLNVGRGSMDVLDYINKYKV